MTPGNPGGVVFKIDKPGIESVIHYFAKGTDGSIPAAALIDVNGELYGTTTQGGTGACYRGCGTVFKICPTGAYVVLHNFLAAKIPDGLTPSGPLTYANGVLYGETNFGAVYNTGTVYALTP